MIRLLGLTALALKKAHESRPTYWPIVKSPLKKAFIRVSVGAVGPPEQTA